MDLLIAVVAMIVYMAISYVVGDRFGFSRYSMYAAIKGRYEGAVLYVLAGDRFVEPDDLDAVHGIDVSRLDPKPYPCSQQWLCYEAQRWLSSRMSREPLADALPIEIGYRLLRVDEQGVVHERLEQVTRGTGRLRP